MKALFWANGAVFAFQIISTGWWKGPLYQELGAMPGETFSLTGFYRLFTYMWLHSVSDPQHILFNLFAIWLCGGMLEEKIRWRWMLVIYILSGLGGGAAAALFTRETLPTVGASGAIFGITAAWGYYLANREIYFLFVLRLKVKYVAMALIGLNLLLCLLPHGGSNVSYVGHVGGALIGALLVFSSPLYRSQLDKFKIRADLRAMENETAVRQRVDALLEKISREGISNLTDEERKFLLRSSKNFNHDE